MSEWVQWDNSRYGEAYGLHCLVSGRNGSTTQGAYDSYYSDGSNGTVGIRTEIWGVNPNKTSDAGWIYANTIALSNSFDDASWHMITETVTAGQYQVYVDGALAGSSTMTAGYTTEFSPDSTAYLTVAADGYGRMGSLADFQLYGTVLSADQIQEVYQDQVLVFGTCLPLATPVQLARGATFDLNGSAHTIDSLADSSGSGGTVTTSVSGAIALTLAPTGTTSFSGVIQDGAGQINLIMNGPGTQILAGSNTYTGATTINGGVLEITGSGVYSAGFAVNSGTLEVAGLGVIDGSGSLSGTGIILIVPGGSLAAKNFGGNVVVVGGTLSGATGATPAVGGLLVSSGSVCLADGQTIAVGNGGLLIAPGTGATVNMTGGLLVQGGSVGASGNWWGGAINVGDPSAGGPGGTSNPAVLNISGGTLQAGNWAGDHAGAGLQVGVGGAAGIVNQSGGVVNVEGWDAFAVGGAIFGGTPGQGTYNLSAGTLNTGYYGNGYTEVGVAGGTGVVKVSGGVWNISADAPGGPGGGQGGSSLLNIGSGNAPDFDAAGAGSVVITGGQVHAFGGITIGNVYNQGGVGSLSLQGGLLDLASGTAGAFGGMILVGSGGTLAASSGTLQNVTEILGSVTVSGSTASGSPMALSKSDSGLLVLAGTNTYTGGTTVSSGTLDFSTPDATPSVGIVTVEPGGYVVLGALLGASSPATETNATETASEASETSGTVATTSPASAGGDVASGGEDWLGGTGSKAEGAAAAAVPEPSTFVLLGVGLLGLLGYARRRVLRSGASTVATA